MCRLDRFAAAIFDLDDTLYLERDYVQSGFHAVGRWLCDAKGWCPEAAREFGRACWRGFLRGDRRRTFDRSLTALGRPAHPELVAEMVACYRQHSPSIRVCWDVMPVLARLAAKKMPLGLITDGHSRVQRRKLRALAIDENFAEIVVTGQWGRNYWKPHERAFVHMESSLGVRAAECLYVGDNPLKDFLAPQRRGWTTVRIRRSGGIHCHAASSGELRADFQYVNLQQWLNDWCSRPISDPLSLGGLGTGAK